MSSLVFMSGLEELVIHCAQPSSLGATLFQSLVVHPVHTSNMDVTSSPGELSAPLCPSLRRLALKYDRWLRPTEIFDLIPVFVSFVESRQDSNRALERFDIWTTSNQKDPLALIERSQMSVEGFRRLAEASAPTDFQVTPLTVKTQDGHHHYHDHVTSRISLNREMQYKGVILAPALPNKSQLVLRCRAECRSCSNATSTAGSERWSSKRCRPTAFDLEPVPVSDLKSDQPFELKFRQDKSNGPLLADVTFLIRHRPIAPRYSDQEQRCLSESLM